ncbi:membrane-targeted effector domain-containing toxin, partial [Dyella sp.]|uniref:membrane-targeted effector domain-containing toxin n=1 Tax=Dyella sp. TaxID=1869338 RepID=UPI002ED41749
RPANLPEVASYGVYRLDNQDYVRIDGNYYRSAQNANGRYIYDGNPSHRITIRRSGNGWDVMPPSVGRGGMHRVRQQDQYLTPAQDIPELRRFIKDNAGDGSLAPEKELFEVPSGENPVIDAAIDRANKLLTDAEKNLADIAVTKFFDAKLPDISQVNNNEKSLIQAIYSKNHGMVIGELHTETTARDFLITHMADLRENGVTTLYAEGYYEWDLSSLINQELRYQMGFNSPPALPPRGEAKWKDVIKHAMHHGIKVIPIDSLAARTIKGPPGGPERIQAQNYYAQMIINSEQSKPGAGKWVAFEGAAHIGNYRYSSPEGTVNVAGLAQATGVPSVRVSQAPAGTPSTVIFDPGSSIEAPGLMYWWQADLLLTRA